MTHERRSTCVWLLAAMVGSIVFFVWIGYARTLNPHDLRWIFHEDPFTHAIGWEQFRNAPLVQYPITKNAQYGLEWSSSLVFSDSIPLAALVLRPFAGVLPHPFQYLGLWVWGSLVLQSYWGMRLVLLRWHRLRDAALGAAFFATAPVLIERLGLQTAVGSHWLLLWALWIYSSANGPAMRSWLAPLFLAIGVHAYLFVMVFGIWLAHLVACRKRRVLARRDLVHAAGVLVLLVLTMHVLGYFLVGDGVAAGSWRSRLDLVGLISPSDGARLGVVPSYYNTPWDGSAYLGAGFLVLLLSAVIAWIVRRPPGSPSPVRWSPLVAVLIGFALFAVTNNIEFAHHNLVSLPLPYAVDVLYQTFRGAARMIWPAYYAVMIAGLWLVPRAWPQRAVTWVLGTALCIQLVDLSGMAVLKQQEVKGDGLVRKLANPIWRRIANHQQRIISVPAYYRQWEWPTFAWFAARNGLGSNIGYLSRSNSAARAAGTREHLQEVASGRMDPATTYYFPSAALWDVGRQMMHPEDLAVIADGFRLIIPGGRAWAATPALPPPDSLLGVWISFAEPDRAGLFVDGWSWAESWGTWSNASAATLVLPVPANERVRVSFKWLVSNQVDHSKPMRVQLGDASFAVEFSQPGVVRNDTFEVTTTSRLLDVRLEVGELECPLDERPIAVGLVAARIQRASDPIDEGLPAGATRAGPR